MKYLRRDVKSRWCGQTMQTKYNATNVMEIEWWCETILFRPRPRHLLDCNWNRVLLYETQNVFAVAAELEPEISHAIFTFCATTVAENTKTE